MKPEETILIPIKASEELPPRSPEYAVKVLSDKGKVYYNHIFQKWFNHQTETEEDVKIWYKPISKKEYDRQEIEKRTCQWVYNEECDFYNTQCNSEYALLDGTLEENKHNYCPNCGGKIINHIKEQLSK